MKQLLIALCIISSLVLTGCPTKTLEKAEASSRKLATYANAGVDVTRNLFRQNMISVATKDKIADGFIVLAKGGQAFDLAVANAKREYGTNPPKEAINKLFATFDAEVLGRFLAVLQELRLISNATAYTAVIESIKAAVLIIGGAFNRKAEVQLRFI